MSERGIRKGDRFRWWNSDRSGFQFGFSPLTSPPNSYYREDGRPVRDNGIIVSPDEYDQPPPSQKPLGGPDIGVGARANSSFATDSNVYAIPSESQPNIQYLTSTSVIGWNYNNIPIYIVGSNNSITLGTNSLAIGPHGTYISLYCVGSSVTMNSGNGITFDFINKPSLRMDSGSIMTLISNATDSTWHVTSFSQDRGF